jgi:hypothetical protein
LTDNLRDRIAAAIKAEDEKPHLCPFPTMASYDRLADAVIAALNLEVETRYGTSVGREVNVKGHYTEWVSDTPPPG